MYSDVGSKGLVSSMPNMGWDPELLTVTRRGFIEPASRFIDDYLEAWNERHKLVPYIHVGSNDMSYDNAAIEYRTSATDCLEYGNQYHAKYIMHADNAVRWARMTRRIHKTSRLTFSPAAPLRVHDMSLDSVKRFGCSPSYIFDPDGSGMATKSRSLADPSTERWRSAGFHLHIGDEGIRRGEDEDVLRTLAARRSLWCDAYLGLLDVIMNNSLGWSDASKVRRQVLGYGRASEFRWKEMNYGGGRIEYRTMSPWPLISPVLTWFTMSMYRTIMSERDLPHLKYEHADIQRIINEDDAEAAYKIWMELPTGWNCRLGSDSSAIANTHMDNFRNMLKHGGVTWLQSKGLKLGVMGWRRPGLHGSTRSYEVGGGRMRYYRERNPHSRIRGSGRWDNRNFRPTGFFWPSTIEAINEEMS